MTDREALEAYRRTGSPEAWSELVRRHAAAVHSACRRMLADAHAAEDAAQATFLVFLRRGRSLGAGTVLADWLHRTARNCARNLLREESRRREREREAGEMTGRRGEGREARDEATWDDVRPHLDAALDELPAAQREALALRYLRGLSREEISRELDCPERTVESRLRLGLEKLREKLSKRGAAVPAAALVGFLGERAVESAPANLIASIQALGTGTAAAATASASVAAFSTAEAVMKAMFWAKAKLWATTFAAAAVLGTGGAVAVHRAMAGDGAKPVAVATPESKPQPAAAVEPSKGGPAKEKITPEENAATYYKKAIAARAAYPNQELLSFLCVDVSSLTPDFILEMPGAAEAILKDKDMVGFVRQGARLSDCDFEGHWSESSIEPAKNVAVMRDLARRMIAWGRYLEAQEKSGEAFSMEAATAYLDALRMGFHLDSRGTPIETMIGQAVAGMALGRGGLLGMMTRDPGRETAKLMLERLSAIPDRPFDISRSLDCSRTSVQFLGRLKATALKDRTALLRQIEKAAQNAGDDDPSDDELLKIPELKRLPNDKDELAKLAETWAADYDRNMGLLVEASVNPYYRAKPKLDELAKRLDVQIDGSGMGKYEVALQPVRSSIRTVVGTARIEAQLGATKILAAACLEKATTGQFPASLDGLKKHFPKGLPIDPFTGKDFQYRIENDLPTVECEGDSPEAKKKTPFRYVFSLSEIKRQQERRTVEWRARLRGEAPPAPAAPELPGFPGEGPELF